jgi:muconolactone delta-isomerase
VEYLVTMTTHVPEGTPDEAVADVRVRGRRSAELAAHPNDPGIGASRS